MRGDGHCCRPRLAMATLRAHVSASPLEASRDTDTVWRGNNHNKDRRADRGINHYFLLTVRQLGDRRDSLGTTDGAAAAASRPRLAALACAGTVACGKALLRRKAEDKRYLAPSEKSTPWL